MFKGRYTTGNVLINNPISVLQHLKQLQNWSELGVAYNWGKEVVSESLIKTTGEGSFNDVSLDPIKTLCVARQFNEDVYTADAVESIIKEFFLISYQDENGYECVKYLFSREYPEDEISYSDIKGNVGSIIPAQMQNINCCPAIRYGFCYATEKFLYELRVDNVWESTFNSTYVSGFEGSDGETAWNTIHTLWNDIRQIEPAQNEVVESKWIIDYAGALWKLQNMIILMQLKGISFSLGYTKARKWRVGKHFYLTLSYHTNNRKLECVVTSIDPKKYSNEVTVNVLFLDYLTTSEELELKYLQEGDYGFFEVGDAGFIEQ